jgi:hypothetical protein
MFEHLWPLALCERRRRDVSKMVRLDLIRPWRPELEAVEPFPVIRKKVSSHFQWAEKSVDLFPVELSNYFLLVNFVDPYPDGHQFGPFPVELSIHFSLPV